MIKHVIAVVGATAIGKTALSIKLAMHFDCPIISCDSRQFYKEMQIGTAVPDPEELSAAKHYFIQDRSVFDHYSVGQYERDALEKLDKLFKLHQTVILVGGSGLYADALLKGLDYFPDVDPEIRVSLNHQIQEQGIATLQDQLKELDPVSFESIEIDNPHRLIRALEICIGTGKKYSDFKNKPKAKRNFKTIKIGLTAERQIMYDRINHRVDLMIENGLLEEAQKLFPHKNLNALQTVGYRELFRYLDDDITLKTAIEEIKKNTRRFAKRQVTWNKKDLEINWFDFRADFKDIVTSVENLMEIN